MANRYPLIVNPNSNKIEELGLSDNLNLTQNNIVANGSTGTNGQYLKSDGTKVVWDFPGDVYLTTTQTISNKTFTSCTINGSSNTISNIANSSLSNSSITVNGVSIPLGGSVTTPDTNTTYNYSSFVNSPTQVALRLVGSDSSTDEIILEAGNNTSFTRVLLSESGGNHSSKIIINSSDTTTTYGAGNGLQLSGTSFSLKDNAALNDYFMTKWDNSNKKLVSSVIRQDPITNNISINGSSTFTCASEIQGAVLSSGNGILLRKEQSLPGDARIQVNRNFAGTSFSCLQWYETGGYWRIDDGSSITPSNTKALVTETDLQTITNKTLITPVLRAPDLQNQGASVPTASNLTVTNNLISNTTLSVLGNSTFNKVTRKTTGLLSTVIPVVAGIATINTATSSEFLGTLSGPVTAWQFTNIDAVPNTATEITLTLQGNAANTYGDAVEIVATGGGGTVVTNGIRWVGGTPPTATSNVDVLTFKIIALDPLDYIVIGSYTTNIS